MFRFLRRAARCPLPPIIACSITESLTTHVCRVRVCLYGCVCVCVCSWLHSLSFLFLHVSHSHVMYNVRGVWLVGWCGGVGLFFVWLCGQQDARFLRHAHSTHDTQTNTHACAPQLAAQNNQSSSFVVVVYITQMMGIILYTHSFVDLFGHTHTHAITWILSLSSARQTKRLN